MREFGSKIVYPEERMEEKSPVRMAAGSVVMTVGLVCRELYSSKFDMKNSRFFPLNSFGIRTGPPNS